jgi:hypothetical protein
MLGFTLHSNEKLQVFATEAFRSEKSTKTSNYSTEVTVETTSNLSPKILGKLHISQKRRKKIQSSTRRAENRINFFTDSIWNQHPKLRVMNFARDFQGPKLRISQILPKFKPKFRLSGNRRILRSFGRK